MSFIGIVEHGIVKLPAKASLPEGTKVRIEPILKAKQKLRSSRDKRATGVGSHSSAPNPHLKKSTLLEFFAPLKGSGIKLTRRKDLPRKWVP
jgi:hypothetical protein